jgi:hypothetical protein
MSSDISGSKGQYVPLLQAIVWRKVENGDGYEQEHEEAADWVLSTDFGNGADTGAGGWGCARDAADGFRGKHGESNRHERRKPE